MLTPFAYLKERGFQYAVAGSVLWHVFWLFVVTVNFEGVAVEARKNTRIYFLGQVLSDQAFNMILATKPELSETVYRAVPEAEETLEPEIQNLGHQAPGDVVSVPSGRSAWNSLQGVLGSSSGHHESFFYEKLKADLIKSPFPVSGDLTKRDLLYLPEPPKTVFPADASSAPAEAVFQLTVDAQGKVKKIENTISSGDPKLDLLWQGYLKDWQFLPLAGGSGPDQTGQVRLRPAPARRGP